MIYIILGTRAQLVKMAPVIKEIEHLGWAMTLVHTGQHKEGIEELNRDFQIKTEWKSLYKKDEEVKTIFHAIKWLITLVLTITFKPKSLLDNSIQSENNIVIVHGDTFSTILGALIGKRMGIKVAHIESGLRSFNYFNPFPEEINRLITFRLADIAFCPGPWAVNNLKSHKNLLVIDTENNTLLDSLKMAINSPTLDNQYRIPTNEYGVVSIHRFENIFFTKIFNQIIDQIIDVSKSFYIIFVLHPSTIKRLKKTKLINKLILNSNIELRERTGYFNFVKLISQCRFVITDGGSNQEELAYLKIPAFLMRKTTERQEGLNDNVHIGGISKEKLEVFLRELNSNSVGQKTLPVNSPSKIICQKIEFASERQMNQKI